MNESVYERINVSHIKPSFDSRRSSMSVSYLAPVFVQRFGRNTYHRMAQIVTLLIYIEASNSNCITKVSITGLIISSCYAEKNQAPKSALPGEKKNMSCLRHVRHRIIEDSETPVTEPISFRLSMFSFRALRRCDGVEISYFHTMHDQRTLP